MSRRASASWRTRWGTPLFSRHSRGVTLTAAGSRLLPYAVRMGRLLDDARRAAGDDGRPSGSLTIGSLETTAALRLSPGMAAFAADFPAVDLVLNTGTTEELIAAVLAHRLEGAFVCGPVDHPELAERVVFREELVAGHRTRTGRSARPARGPGSEDRRFAGRLFLPAASGGHPGASRVWSD